jgi:hypothetical protein
VRLLQHAATQELLQTPCEHDTILFPVPAARCTSTRSIQLLTLAAISTFLLTHCLTAIQL